MTTKKYKFNKFGKLPGRPSELIRLALKDLAAVERSKKYVVNMGDWHTPVYGCMGTPDKCAVCLAGAVMVKERLATDPTIEAGPWNYAKEEFALSALNEFRCGHIGMALRFLGLPGTIYKQGCEFTLITDYAIDPKKFRADMRQLAKDLEAEGL